MKSLELKIKFILPRNFKVFAVSRPRNLDYEKKLFSIGLFQNSYFPCVEYISLQILFFIWVKIRPTLNVTSEINSYFTRIYVTVKLKETSHSHLASRSVKQFYWIRSWCDAQALLFMTISTGYRFFHHVTLPRQIY